MTEATNAGDRVLVRAPNWLGDAVLALPAMGALRRHFAGRHLTVAGPPGVAALFRERTDVAPDEIVELPVSSRSRLAALRGGGFRLGVLFPNSFGSAWQLRRAGVPERWGYATAGRGVLLSRRAARPRHRGPLHQVEYYRALVRSLGVECDDRLPRLAPSAPSRARADDLLARGSGAPPDRLIGFAPGAAYGEAKRWPPVRVAETIARLVADHDATCVVLGALHDRATAREIESWLRAHAPGAVSRVIDLVGRTSLGALVGIAAACRVFVSNDSGAMHVAAALGRPVVALFGPTDERVTGPLGPHTVITHPVFCRPCGLRDCPIDHRCMKRLSVDTVVAAVAAALTRPAA